MKYIIFGLVMLILLSFPFLYQIFGKEDGCGRSLWDKIKRRLSK